MSKYLDNTGLSYLWQKIKGTYVKQEAGKQLSTNDFTNEEKQKLSKINENLALEQTCQEIKQNVNMVNNKLGGFTGNTDTVETDLENLKNNMAQLQTKVDQLLSKGGGFNPFNELVWADKLSLAQIDTGKTYKIFYVPKFYMMNGSLDPSLTVNNSEGGNCEIFINDYRVYGKTSRFTFDILMPFVEFNLRIEHSFAGTVELQYPDINLFWKQIK